MTGAAGERGWLIGPRTVPPPAAASGELYGELASATAPDAEATATTPAEWKQVGAAEDRARVASVQAAAAAAGVTVQADEVAGVAVFRITPPVVAEQHRDHLFVHVHGGSFFNGAGRPGAGAGSEIAARAGIVVLDVDYRLAPDHPAPAAMDDVVAVWRAVTARRPAGRTALGGTSAGANLTLVATLRLKELGLALPGALFVGTPVVDVAKRGDSRFILEGLDRVLVSWEAELVHALAFYAPGRSAEDLLVSPIFGDFSGFPPTYLISGTRDLLLSDTVRVHRRLRQAGAIADLHVYEGMAHADYEQSAELPESAEHYAELDAFLTHHLSA